MTTTSTTSTTSSSRVWIDSAVAIVVASQFNEEGSYESVATYIIYIIKVYIATI